MHRLNVGAVALLIAALATLTAPAGPAAAATPQCNGKTATQFLTAPGTLTGTPGVADVLVGSSGIDSINGGDEDDTICGGGGGDTITGGPGNDTIFGQDGDDIINGNEGDDVISGGNGNDLMNGDEDDDSLHGDDGDDFVYDILGINVGHGDAGSDEVQIFGKAYGDAGNDAAVLASDPDTTGPLLGLADGGPGNDGVLFGTTSHGNPTVVAVSGGTADGGSGNDVVAANLAGDTALGGSGSDFVFTFNALPQNVDCGSAYDTYFADPIDTVRRCEAIFSA